MPISGSKVSQNMVQACFWEKKPCKNLFWSTTICEWRMFVIVCERGNSVRCKLFPDTLNCLQSCVSSNINVRLLIAILSVKRNMPTWMWGRLKEWNEILHTINGCYELQQPFRFITLWKLESNIFLFRFIRPICLKPVGKLNRTPWSLHDECSLKRRIHWYIFVIPRASCRVIGEIMYIFLLDCFDYFCTFLFVFQSLTFGYET